MYKLVGFSALWLALMATLMFIPGIERITPARATEAIGDYWRLPWVAGVEHMVGGNGYGQGTHNGTEYFALDFNLDSTGDYEVAAQQGQVWSFGDVDPNNPCSGSVTGFRSETSAVIYTDTPI